MTSLAALQEKAHACTACPLRATASRVVYGCGDPDSGIVLVGRDPGVQEDRGGQPFIGPAGKVLDDSLALAGISRDRVFITNLVLCHTPNNRGPRKEEMAVCGKLHLLPLLRLLRPRLVVAYSRETIWALTGINKPVSSTHGVPMEHEDGFTVLPAVHPAACLHNPDMLFEIRNDALMLKNIALRLGLPLQSSRATSP